VGEADTQWVVNYDQFGNVASVVSPKPSVDSFVSAADNDRLARTYSYNHSNEGNWSQVHWGVLADMGEPTQVAKGAIYLTETVFDGAWRPLRAKDAAGRESFQVWDTVNDRLIGQVSPNQKMKSRVYDYLETDGDPSKSTRLANLGRETQTWGPAPQSWFPVSKDSLGNLECDNPCRPTGSHGIKDVTAVQQLFDTGDNNALGGLLATTFTDKSLSGEPAGAFGVCAAAVGGCPTKQGDLVTWGGVPDQAGLSGGSWSAQFTGTRAAPKAGKSNQYRLTSDAHGDGSLWVNGACTTNPSKTTDCGSDNTAATAKSTGKHDALTLQVQYVRDDTNVDTDNPVTIKIQESSDSGKTWATLSAGDVDAGYGLKSGNQGWETFKTGGDPAQLTQTTTFTDPMLGQTNNTSVTGTDGLTLANKATYEDYDGQDQWGRALTTTTPGGSTYGTQYWGSTQTATDPCTTTVGGVADGELGTGLEWVLSVGIIPWVGVGGG
jgi:hypothetical protein